VIQRNWQVLPFFLCPILQAMSRVWCYQSTVGFLLIRSIVSGAVFILISLVNDGLLGQ
jgi:hypothetical protein